MALDQLTDRSRNVEFDTAASALRRAAHDLQVDGWKAHEATRSGGSTLNHAIREACANHEQMHQCFTAIIADEAVVRDLVKMKQFGYDPQVNDAGIYLKAWAETQDDRRKMVRLLRRVANRMEGRS